ncbi:putative sugar transporter [Diplodia seriata]|uniref:Putative sugar transporter n=1 Tax=Diplodia seriata TaxID=420778 RepID=A0A0G2E0W2_9PEZI|nr:putative sugar transporter [Diplodia seriata]
MDSAWSEKDLPGYDARSVRSASTTSSGNTHVPPVVHYQANERDVDRYRNSFGAIIDTTYMQPGGDDVYDAKVKLLNEALLDMGMGRYQWLLTVVTGLGWFLDSFWMFSFAFIQPAVQNEAKFFTSNAALLTVCQYVGLTVGASVLPMVSDFIGRKTVFNFSLALMCITGLIGAGMPTFTGLCVVATFMSIAAGGNQAVDSSIFLEIIPASHQYLLTMQGAYSGLGKLVAALVSWPLISKYSCAADATPETCNYATNMGWRYAWWTLGAITCVFCIIRYFFTLHETPKFLLGQNRDADVVATVTAIAHHNGRQTWLTLDAFQHIEKIHGPPTLRATPANSSKARLCLQPFRPSWLRTLFCTRNLRTSTTVLIVIWSLVGLAFPLHAAFVTRWLAARHPSTNAFSTSLTFQTHVYTALCAIPGPIVAGFLIETERLGRKKTGAAATLLAGVLSFAYASARSKGDVIAWQCVLAFAQNAVVSLMFLYVAETFAAPVRGTGMGVVGAAGRAAGLVGALVVALCESSSSSAPVWVASGCWVVAGALWMALPYEMRARASN